jgi:hypothetical protein
LGILSLHGVENYSNAIAYSQFPKIVLRYGAKQYPKSSNGLKPAGYTKYKGGASVSFN